jgi:hypothetical protein
MTARGSVVYFIALAAALAACGGSDGPPPIVVPEVPVGAFEAGCQQLCALGAGETICTPKHSEYCVARCRAATNDLPQACGDCLIANGTPILGTPDPDPQFDDSCNAGEVGSLTSSSCRAACDDAGAAPPSQNLDLLCRLECMFYTSDHTPFACSASAVGDDCLMPCQALIAAQGRICAQCTIGQNIGTGKICFNDECECLNSLSSSMFGCETLCDTMPPM